MKEEINSILKIKEHNYFPFTRFVLLTLQGDLVSVVGYGVVYPNYEVNLHVKSTGSNVTYKTLDFFLNDFAAQSGFIVEYIDNKILTYTGEDDYANTH